MAYYLKLFNSLWDFIPAASPEVERNGSLNAPKAGAFGYSTRRRRPSNPDLIAIDGVPGMPRGSTSVDHH